MSVIRASIFNAASPLVLAVLVCALPPAAALAQQSAASPAAAQPAAPSREIPTPEQLEPGVSTSPAAPAPAASETPGAADASRAPQAPSAAQPERSRAGRASPAKAAPRAGAGGDKAAARNGPDRLQLDTTEITGNRELPKVLYIVPWKRSDLGDLVGRPANSLLDEVLQPLDRDVFRRENRYYDALKPDATAPAAGAAQGSGGKP